MDKFLDGMQYFLNLGPTVILPFAILLIGLFFRTGFMKAFKAGLTIGIGFVGINLVIGVLTGTLGPAAKDMVDRFGLNLHVIDAGWPAAAAISFASPVAAVILPLCLIVNIVLIGLKVTKTLNIDIWNYWHFIAAGATGYVLTNNWFVAIALAVIMQIIVLIIADKTQPMVEKFYGLEGITLPTASTISFVPLGYAVSWVLQKIPGYNKLQADPENIQKRFGIFGEPMMMGFVLGIFIGLLAGYDFGGVFNVGISMAAVMFLLPRMVKILMEGLIPISEAARDYLQKRYEGRDLYIGLDAALAVGHPAVMSTALILVPITLFLAVILPGNQVLPFGDLATIPFLVAFIVGFNKGNIIHSVIVGTIVIAASLYMATDFAPTFTAMLESAKFDMPKGASQVSNLDTGGNLLNWLALKIGQLLQGIM